MAEAPKAPDGFKAVDYEGHTLLVCSKCSPQWDAYDPKQAKAHADAGVHRPEGAPVERGQL